MNQFKVGIIGCGNIAVNMVNTIKEMDNVCVYACAARSIEKAKEFSLNYNIQNAYGSYEELVMDNDIDLVYIATPHSHHYEHIKLCLNNNKHILCEKAFTVNKNQAVEVFKLAKSKKLLLAEAMWTRYTPMAYKLKELVDSDIIGKITTIKSEIYYPISGVSRVHDPNLAGGVLLDLGIYNLAFTRLITNNKIVNINSSCTKFDSGVDKQMGINIIFEDDIVSMISCGTESICPQESVIIGTNGYIKVYHLTNYSKIEVFDNNNNSIRIIEREKQITGFEYQVLECIDAIKNKKLEVLSMPHENTLDLLEICDTVRKQNNINYPFE